MIGKSFFELILKWGKDNFRDFPWRNTKNPYHIFIAEFLLQKTHSKMAERAYHIFLNRYPTITDLNEARLQDIQGIFKKIGLMYRAERIKAIAKLILNESHEIPKERKKLLSLPGIGKYMTNAILCFGYNQRVPIVDVNVARILMRFFGLPEANRPQNNKIVWEKALEILPEIEYKRYNWLLLDFGSIVCSSKPKCSICPLICECKYKINVDNRCNN